jgi:hypothetical protein
MSAPLRSFRTRHALAALGAGGCLLLVGCSGGSSAASMSAAGRPAARAVPAAAPALPGGAVKQAQLTVLPPA